MCFHTQTTDVSHLTQDFELTLSFALGIFSLFSFGLLLH